MYVGLMAPAGGGGMTKRWWSMTRVHNLDSGFGLRANPGPRTSDMDPIIPVVRLQWPGVKRGGGGTLFGH